jgi:hypothetical protein
MLMGGQGKITNYIGYSRGLGITQTLVLTSSSGALPKFTPQYSILCHCHVTQHRGPSMVAHSYNPSYSGDGDQEDSRSRPTLGKNLETPTCPIKARHDGACLSSQLLWET